MSSGEGKRESLNCLLGTGAEMSTLKEEFFRNHLSPLGHHGMDTRSGCQWVACALSWLRGW